MSETKAADEFVPPRGVGAVLHSAALYDFGMWLTLRGRGRALQQNFLQLARIVSGETALDVGCGTGTLAIMAKRRVGSAGAVCGIDASLEMIRRARSKARRAGVDVAFEGAVAQTLPFPDASFDVVLATLMLHHVGRNGRRRIAVEMHRVAKPGGRVLVVEFARSTRKSTGILGHLHRGHGAVGLDELLELLAGAGLAVRDSGTVGAHGLHFIRAEVPPS